jgi:hypothetical protein
LSSFTPAFLKFAIFLVAIVKPWCWEEVTEGALAANFQKTALSGVGNRVDWAWAQVIEWVRSE